MNYPLLTKPFYYLCFSLLAMLLCSFSGVPATQQASPPVEKKETSKRQKRLNKRLNHFYKNFDQAKNTKKQAYWQKKIRKIERLQNQKPTPVIGIVGLGLGVISFMCFFAAALYSFTAPALAVFAAIFGLAGLITSAVGSALCKKFPERYSMRGFAIAGIIVGSIFLALSLSIFVGRI